MHDPGGADAAKQFDNQFQLSLEKIEVRVLCRLRSGDCSMSSPAISFGRLLRRFRDNRTGASAVEFAIVAPIFLALLFAIIEVALMFFASQVLETITQDSARMILTGQAQGASYQQSDFKTYVCNQIPALFSCANLVVNVQSAPSFSALTFNTPFDASCNLQSSNVKYSPGGPGDVVLVQVFYPWQLFVTGLGFNIANCPNNQRQLVATAAFKNEPYQ
jgi:Flp pilus assembly protein TadG